MGLGGGGSGRANSNSNNKGSGFINVTFKRTQREWGRSKLRQMRFKGVNCTRKWNDSLRLCVYLLLCVAWWVGRWDSRCFHFRRCAGFSFLKPTAAIVTLRVCNVIKRLNCPYYIWGRRFGWVFLFYSAQMVNL